MTDEELAEDSFSSKKLLYKSSTDKRSYIDGFLAGLEAGRPKWHKVADGDLPKNSDDEKLYLVYWGENDYGVAQLNDGRWWSFDSGWYDVEEVIAWCKVSAFKKE